MPVTQISCPNCRQPISAEIDQLFDVAQDPSAKQRLLSGTANLVQCPHCGYQGTLATPVVYHDPDKELLLTFVPPEIGLPRDEQEKLIGGLINRVVNNLPQEKRKAYLLQPQAALTMQGLVERILEADGITKEMIQAQQERLNLIQRLLTVSDESLETVVEEEDELIDAQFFGLLHRLIEASVMGGDRAAAEQLNHLQQVLLPITTYGREVQAQSQEVEQAVKDLQDLGKELDREKLLDLVSKAPNDTRLSTYVSFTRPLMDYTFFQMLSERIDRARGDGRTRLAELREKLLEMTNQLDQQIQARAQAAHQLIEQILQSGDIANATAQSLPAVDEFFLQELNQMQESAREQGDLDRLGKLQKILDVVKQASESPPEIALLEELLEAPDDQALRQSLEEHQDEITPEFLNALANIVGQVEESDDKQLAERIKNINRMALRFSMQRNLQ
jgi:uncharacterized protein YjgD (DUF1641 family)